MILPLESQVTSYEISKRLKELGCRQDSLFSHIQIKGLRGHSKIVVSISASGTFPAFFDNDLDDYYSDCIGGSEVSAYTVAELGNLLPDYWNTYHDEHGNWNCDNADSDVMEIQLTEADARGKALIYLLENHIIEVKK
jgi:hypothetical protein